MSAPSAGTDLSSVMRSRGDGTLELALVVGGINCGGCVARIERTLAAVPGVVEARVNFTNRRLAVAWREGALDPQALIGTLSGLGYDAHPFVARDVEDGDAREARQLLKYLAVAGFAAMNIMLLSVSVWSGNASDITPETRDFFHWLSALIALPAVAYAGQPFFRSAFAALRARAVNMDVPIALGVSLAVAMSLVETVRHAEHVYFDSAVMLLFFLLCGRYLDRAMRQRTRMFAGNLAALRADRAFRIGTAEALTEVPADALRQGDRIVIRPGDRVPADGTVIAGQSEIDESLVTGETARRALLPGDTVYAGSLNFSGALTVEVTAAGADTLLDEIARLIDRALKAKSRYVRLADKAAGYYAPVVHTTAALTLAGWLAVGASLHDGIIAAISVLIITCPCALALAVPVVQVIAAGRLFRNGVILNGGDAIERFAGVDTVVFDKTGTLTLPEPSVTNAAAVPAGLLDLAARLALSSRHPLAAAVAAERRGLAVIPGAIEEPGRGVRAVVDGEELRLGSPEFCGIEGEGAVTPDQSTIACRYRAGSAIFCIAQRLRPDAAATVERLRGLGLEVTMLSGDRAEAVAPVARSLGIAAWVAGARPAQKVAALADMRSAGRRVLMVGDGINDAPSLSEAFASMSPVSAAELTQAQADAVFLGAHLAPVADTILIARRARRLMIGNLALAVIYNAVAVPVAVAGLVTPLIAALAMSGSSLLVTANAMRLQLRAAERRKDIAVGREAQAGQAEFATP